MPFILAEVSVAITAAVLGFLASLLATMLKEFITRFHRGNADKRITLKVQGRTIEVSASDTIEFNEKVDAILESLENENRKTTRKVKRQRAR